MCLTYITRIRWHSRTGFFRNKMTGRTSTFAYAVLLLFCVLATEASAADAPTSSPHLLLRTLEEDGVIRIPAGLPTPHVSALHTAATAHFDRIRNAAERRSLHNVVPQNIYDSNRRFCFHDVTQRDPGKYEVKIENAWLTPHATANNDNNSSSTLLWESYITAPLPTSPTPWAPLVRAALGDDAELYSASMIYSTHASFFGEPAQDQGWHSDGSFTCGNCQGTPGRYAVVVYIPLEDVADEHGGKVEYLPGSHVSSELYGGDHQQLVQSGRLSTYEPTMQAGDILVWDFRLVHRGLARRDPSSPRPVLKLDYFRKGQADADNTWCKERLLNDDDDDETVSSLDNEL